jgi:hypothetical protein
MEKELLDIINFANNSIETQKLFKANYSKELAPDFNTLDFMDLNENKISELLAFFLDPHQKHAQGDSFFKLFFEHFEINWGVFDSTEINVSLEYPTLTKRRIDIMVKLGHFKKALGIENKIYHETEDQNGQLIDYVNFLEISTKGDFLLLYLVPKGKEPKASSISKEDRTKYEALGKFRIINYEEHIIPLIRKFREKSENDRLRAFLKDFETKLIKWYIGNNMNNTEEIKKYILENQKIHASFSILSALNLVNGELKKKFEQQIKDLASELGLQEINSFKYKPAFWTNHYITLNYEGGGLLYGITRKEYDPNKTRIEDIENLFHGLESFKNSNWWPLYANLYSNIENNPEFYTDIESEVAIRRVRSFIETILKNQNSLSYL